MTLKANDFLAEKICYWGHPGYLGRERMYLNGHEWDESYWKFDELIEQSGTGRLLCPPSS